VPANTNTDTKFKLQKTAEVEVKLEAGTDSSTNLSQIVGEYGFRYINRRGQFAYRKTMNIWNNTRLRPRRKPGDGDPEETKALPSTFKGMQFLPRLEIRSAFKQCEATPNPHFLMFTQNYQQGAEDKHDPVVKCEEGEEYKCSESNVK
jgi:hypothetical protein